jgi:hypothetical protein
MTSTPGDTLQLGRRSKDSQELPLVRYGQDGGNVLDNRPRPITAVAEPVVLLRSAK